MKDCKGCKRIDICEQVNYNYDPFNNNKKLVLWEKFMLTAVKYHLPYLKRGTEEINNYRSKFKTKTHFDQWDIEWLEALLKSEIAISNNIMNYSKCGQEYIKHMDFLPLIKSIQFVLSKLKNNEEFTYLNRKEDKKPFWKKLFINDGA